MHSLHDLELFVISKRKKKYAILLFFSAGTMQRELGPQKHIAVGYQMHDIMATDA